MNGQVDVVCKYFIITPEGWVEFCDKHVAKTVALMLNNRPVGGKKRSYYHDDIWNIKYLSKFMWTHITEKIGMQFCNHMTIA